MKIRKIIKYINRYGGIDLLVLGSSVNFINLHKFKEGLAFSFDCVDLEYLLFRDRKHLKDFIDLTKGIPIFCDR